MNRPNGIEEVREVFGDVRDFIRKDGTLSHQWERAQITRIQLPKPVLYAYGPAVISKVTIHRLIAEQTAEMYEEVFRLGLDRHLGPYGGGFIYRPNANAKDTISLHAYGIASDWDPAGYPNKSKKKRHPELAAVLRKHGWFLGEDFKGTPDPMHVQFAVNC